MFWYNNLKIEIVSWPANKPWPDTVRIDGKSSGYADAWYSCSGGQYVYYRAEGEKLLTGLPMKKLQKEREALKCSGT